MDKHKIFISYHHANDQAAKNKFVRTFGDAFVDVSVREGDIDDNLKTVTIRQKIRDKWLRDSTVTVVLIGRETWKRKHVDWEIGSSLRRSQYNSRSGLLGILLPSYPDASYGHSYNPKTIPPRLADNLTGNDPYALIQRYPYTAAELRRWIHEAYRRRSRQPDPNNSRDSFGRNRTTQSHW